MPIIGLQRRLREVGRIRLGEVKGKRPVKLSTFRFTSLDRSAIEAAAKAYGGRVRQWQAPSGQQWEVVSDATDIPCVVPPSDVRAFSQWYELWSAGGCQRRCDGETEYISDGPCLCDPAARECAPTTRLSVILPDVPGFGLWRIESHGFYAATELSGAVAVATTAADRGRMLPGRLLATERMVKRLDGDGKPMTLRFVVPALDFDLGMGAIAPAAAAAIPSNGGATGDPSNPGAGVEAPPSPRAVPPPTTPPPTVEAQIAQLDTIKTRKPPAPLPDTGLAPGADQVPGPDPTPPPVAEGEGAPGMSPPPSTTDPEAARRRVMAEAKRTWPDASTEEREGLRHALGVVATYTPRQAEGKPPVASVNEMTIAERLKLSTLLADVRAERMSIARVADTDEGLPRYECALASRSKVATIVRRAVDDWDVSVSNTVQEEPAGE